MTPSRLLNSPRESRVRFFPLFIQWLVNRALPHTCCFIQGGKRVENERIVIGTPYWRDLFAAGLPSGGMLIRIFDKGAQNANKLPPCVLYAMGALLYVCCTV